MKPDWAEAQANLGNALREQGNPDERSPFLRRAVQLKPNFAAAHVNLGSALKDLGKLDEAVACYRRAWTCSRTSPRPTATWALP